MNILVVVGTCLKHNSSANLCHISYLNGLIELGHIVDLITMEERDIPIDESVVVPVVNETFAFYGLSLYEKFSKKKFVKSNNKQVRISNTIEPSKSYIKSLIGKAILLPKRILWNSYGPYGICKPWSNRASKFKSGKKYDLVISLSYPPASNRTVKKLIEKKHIVFEKWVQIWEDPWSSDLYLNKKHTRKIEKAERKIVKYGDRVVYVSPLTLKYQQNKFPESADRMRWFPVPSYYDSFEENINVLGKKVYGYFGDYTTQVRNLLPFYRCAIDKNIELNICGSSNLSLESKNNVNVFPRMPLNELKNFEDRTNVLVVVCNLKGGQIPGKIYQYAATNKVVLFILDGTEEEKSILKDFFGKYNRFIFCENNESSIAEAIDKIENNVFDDVVNAPLDDFKASKTVQKILDCVKD